MKKEKKKSNKIYNPLLGKYLSKGETLVCALVIKTAPDLIAKWKDSGSPLSFDTWLTEIDYNAPLKGAMNKYISKRLNSVVGCLVELWHQSTYETFDTYLESRHELAMVNAPKNSK